MIPGLSPHTSKLVGILGDDPAEEFTYITLAKQIGLPNRDIRGYVTTARRILFRERGICFAAIRGVGLKRMSDEEKGLDQQPRFKKLRRTLKRNIAVSKTIEMSALSKATHDSVLAINAINAALLDKSADISKKINIARIDGVQNVVDIVEAGRKR